ncbi:MAG: hypothetical protein AAF600_19315, partial [Bacteroidota bacterium]
MQGFTETEYGFIKIENSILIFIYKANEQFDEEMADRAIEDRFKLTNKTTYPVLVDIRGVKNFTRGAKELMASKGNKFISAVAIIVKSPVERMIANSYISLNQPPKPTRMFTDE